jgi:hypothetical protein
LPRYAQAHRGRHSTPCGHASRSLRQPMRPGEMGPSALRGEQ